MMRTRLFNSFFFGIIGYFTLFTILYLCKIEYYYLYSLIAFGSFFIFIFILLSFIKVSTINYDNKNIFRTPFHKEYWQKAFKELKNIKNLVMISIMIAFMLLTKLIHLPSGFGNLGVGFTYLFYGITSLLYGPVAGIMLGFIFDNLDFLIFNSGFPYFPGYTLNAMLSGFMYGLCFYKTKISFTKVLLSRIFVNFFVNAFLGTLWWGITSGFTESGQYLSYFILSLSKNVCYLIPQSILLFLVFKALMRFFRATNLVSDEVCNNVSIF